MLISVRTSRSCSLATHRLPGLRTGSNASLEATSYAAFANATYDFTDSLALTVGGRYTFEEKRNRFLPV